MAEDAQASAERRGIVTEKAKPQYFVFAATGTEVVGFKHMTTVATMKEVKAHLDDKDIYADPSDWGFLVIKGRELKIDFEAKVSIG